MTRILGIETSCDETSAAVLEGRGDEVAQKSLVILSQDIHRVFGGVVPDHWDGKIAVHFAHRVGALVVAIASAGVSARAFARHRDRRGLIAPAALMLTLVAAQIALGALTVLTRRDVWINSLHVVCGALVLTTSLVLTLRTWRARFAMEPGVTRAGAAA